MVGGVKKQDVAVRRHQVAIWGCGCPKNTDNGVKRSVIFPKHLQSKLQKEVPYLVRPIIS